jgi:CAAX protease family protein
VNVQPATPPGPDRRGSRINGKLAGWLALVCAISALNYLSNYTVTTSTSDRQSALYSYGTAAGSAVVYAIMLAILMWILGWRTDLLGLRRPTWWLAALGLALGVYLATTAVNAAIDPFLHAGREQGIVPGHWRPRHAGAYAANWVVIAGVAPVVEELTYRGAGFSLLSRAWGSTVAIFAVGILFALSHGLLQALPELTVFGCALAWLRRRTQSVYPGMLVHSAFNSVALASVFWH